MEIYIAVVLTLMLFVQSYNTFKKSPKKLSSFIEEKVRDNFRLIIDKPIEFVDLGWEVQEVLLSISNNPERWENDKWNYFHNSIEDIEVVSIGLKKSNINIRLVNFIWVPFWVNKNKTPIFAA